MSYFPAIFCNTDVVYSVIPCFRTWHFDIHTRQYLRSRTACLLCLKAPMRSLPFDKREPA
jgi:hypothetical protein